MIFLWMPSLLNFKGLFQRKKKDKTNDIKSTPNRNSKIVGAIILAAPSSLKISIIPGIRNTNEVQNWRIATDTIGRCLVFSFIINILSY